MEKKDKKGAQRRVDIKKDKDELQKSISNRGTSSQRWKVFSELSAQGKLRRKSSIKGLNLIVGW